MMGAFSLCYQKSFTGLLRNMVSVGWVWYALLVLWRRQSRGRPVVMA